MPDVKLHQEIFGGKPGETKTVTAAQAAWAVSLGYASTTTSDGNDEPGQPIVDYVAAQDQTLKAVRGPATGERAGLTDAGKAKPTQPLQTPEAFDPDSHTVAEVTTYLNGLTDDAGGRAERRRVKAVEREGQNRAGIADL